MVDINFGIRPIPGDIINGKLVIFVEVVVSIFQFPIS